MDNIGGIANYGATFISLVEMFFDIIEMRESEAVGWRELWALPLGVAGMTSGGVATECLETQYLVDWVPSDRVPNGTWVPSDPIFIQGSPLLYFCIFLVFIMGGGLS